MSLLDQVDLWLKSNPNPCHGEHGHFTACGSEEHKVGGRIRSVLEAADKIKEGSGHEEWSPLRKGGLMGSKRVFKFSTSSGRPFSIDAYEETVSHPLKGSDISFSDEQGRFDQTGEGEAFEIFGKVLPAVVSLVKNNDLDFVRFTGHGKSRLRLYDRLTASVTKALPNYSTMFVDEHDRYGLTRHYVMVHDRAKEKALEQIEEIRGRYHKAVGRIRYITPEIDEAWFTPEGWANLSKEETDAWLKANSHPCQDERGRFTNCGTSSPKRTEPPKTNPKVERALASCKPGNMDKQRYAEAKEHKLADALGGTVSNNNSPVDVTLPGHGIEVKTFLDNDNDKVTMHNDSIARKEKWAKDNNSKLHTVVFDHRDKFDGGKYKHQYSGHEIYYREGVGAFRLHKMTKVDDLEALNKLIRSSEKTYNQDQPRGSDGKWSRSDTQGLPPTTKVPIEDGYTRVGKQVVRYVANPSKMELSGLIKEHTSLRGIADHTNVIVWPEHDAEHETMRNKLDISGALFTVSKFGGQIHAVPSDRPDTWPDDWIEKHPYFKRLSPVYKYGAYDIDVKGANMTLAAYADGKYVADVASNGGWMDWCKRVEKLPLKNYEELARLAEHGFSTDPSRLLNELKRLHKLGRDLAFTTEALPNSVLATNDYLYQALQKADSPEVFIISDGSQDIENTGKAFWEVFLSRALPLPFVVDKTFNPNQPRNPDGTWGSGGSELPKEHYWSPEREKTLLDSMIDVVKSVLSGVSDFASHVWETLKGLFGASTSDLEKTNESLKEYVESKRKEQPVSHLPKGHYWDSSTQEGKKQKSELMSLLKEEPPLPDPEAMVIGTVGGLLDLFRNPKPEKSEDSSHRLELIAEILLRLGGTEVIDHLRSTKSTDVWIKSADVGPMAPRFTNLPVTDEDLEDWANEYVELLIAMMGEEKAQAVINGLAPRTTKANLHPCQGPDGRFVSCVSAGGTTPETSTAAAGEPSPKMDRILRAIDQFQRGKGAPSVVASELSNLTRNELREARTHSYGLHQESKSERKADIVNQLVKHLTKEAPAFQRILGIPPEIGDRINQLTGGAFGDYPAIEHATALAEDKAHQQINDAIDSLPYNDAVKETVSGFWDLLRIDKPQFMAVHDAVDTLAQNRGMGAKRAKVLTGLLSVVDHLGLKAVSAGLAATGIGLPAAGATLSAGEVLPIGSLAYLAYAKATDEPMLDSRGKEVDPSTFYYSLKETANDWINKPGEKLGRMAFEWAAKAGFTAVMGRLKDPKTADTIARAITKDVEPVHIGKDDWHIFADLAADGVEKGGTKFLGYFLAALDRLQEPVVALFVATQLIASQKPKSTTADLWLTGATS